ncbi:hypothetical protein MP638_000532 [Amoeboaphelidium occidentale]|nr:hypothetical protein MP638_000532 [Amoeboaphelidium occidentale]
MFRFSRNSNLLKISKTFGSAKPQLSSYNASSELQEEQNQKHANRVSLANQFIPNDRDMNSFLFKLCKESPQNSSMLTAKRSALVDGALSDMRKSNQVLDKSLYPVLLRFFVTTGKYLKALELFKEMEVLKVGHTVESLVSMLICHKKLGDYKSCLNVYNLAKIRFKNLNYGKHLAERTMLSVYVSLNEYELANQLKNALLSRVTDDEGVRRVYMSYADAFVESKKPELFLKAIDEFKEKGYQLNTDCYNHILIDLSKMRQYHLLLDFLKEFTSKRKQFSGTVRSNGIDPEGDFYKAALEVRNESLAPSTFSDILFNIASDIKKASSAEERHGLLATARIVFAEYEAQILKPYSQFMEIAGKMKQASIEAIFEKKDLQGFEWKDRGVINVNNDKVANLLLRSGNTFVAMSRVLENAGFIEEAAKVAQECKKYPFK